MLTNMQQRTLLALKTIAWLVLLSFSLAAQAQTVTPTATVNWTDVHQTIDGFGAGSQGYVAPMNSTNLDFFYTTSGIGLSIIRLRTWASNAQTPAYGCFAPNGSVCVSNTLAAVAQSDITNALGVQTRGGLVWSSADSSPSPMINSSTGYYIDNPTNNAQLAAIHTAFASLLKSNGVNLYALSLQQEPDNSSPGNPAFVTWTPTNFINTIPFLRSALNTAGFNSVKILTPEPCCTQGSYGPHVGTTPNSWFDPIMTSTTGPDVDILANHAYGNMDCPNPGPNCGPDFYPTAAPTLYGRHYWETEVSTSDAFNPSITDGLQYAVSIHDYLAIANASSYNFWLVDCTGVYTHYANLNWCLNNQSGTIAKRAYVIGNWSKFVRPGWVRIGATATPKSGVFVSAYKDPVSGNFAIVAVNQNASDQPLDFVLNGFTGASVTPWVTSASLDLAQLPSISAGGGTFSDTLPASSVTTFVSASSTAVLPPTSLNATVH
jgi:glucuronoarabinoxylan endo-1,4-beta-xylanase